MSPIGKRVVKDAFDVLHHPLLSFCGSRGSSLSGGGALSENVTHLINQAFVFQVFRLHFRKLLKDAALLARKGRRCDDRDGDKEVSAPPPPKDRHAVPFQAKDCTGLS